MEGSGFGKFAKIAIAVVNSIICLASMVGLVYLLVAYFKNDIKADLKDKIKGQMGDPLVMFDKVLISGIIFFSVVLLFTVVSALGACCESRPLLIAYMVLCGLAALALVSLAVVPYPLKSKIKKKFEDSWYKEVFEQNKLHLSCHDFATFQKKVDDCFYAHTITLKNGSVCANATKGGGNVSCKEAFWEFGQKHAKAVSITCGVIAIVLIISITFHVILYKNIKNYARTMNMSGGPPPGRPFG